MRSRLCFQSRRPASVKAPISRFSITVSDGNTWRPSGHVGDAEMRPARGGHGGEVDILEADAARTSARRMPEMVLNSVVLPAPLGPTIDTNCPSSTVIDTSVDARAGRE